jgi:hypothetical protein
MMIKATTLCQCGHIVMSHTCGVFRHKEEFADMKTILKHPFRNKCGPCFQSDKTRCKGFELNNLDLIEYLAEKRGLI